MEYFVYDRGIEATLPKVLCADPRDWDLSRHLHRWDDPWVASETCGMHLDLVQSVLAYVLEESRFGGGAEPSAEDKNAMDGWFAPRLHASLRIPRRLASQREFWAWFAIEHGAAYVRRRFSDQEGCVTRWRYTGDLLRNAISRLWWGAELGRNGGDYAAVPAIFARTRTAQWALELRYSWYRPVPIAFARVSEGLDGGPRLSDEEAKALSVRVNALLSLRVLEAMGLYEPDLSDDFGSAWRRERPSLDELVSEDGPRGPASEPVPDGALASLEAWLRTLAGGE